MDSMAVKYIFIGINKKCKWCHTSEQKDRCDQLIEAIKLPVRESVSIDIISVVISDTLIIQI